MTDNPFAPPRSRVADAPPSVADGDFVAAGRSVPAGNGWIWIADAWAFTGQQRGTFIGIFVIYVLVSIGVSLVPVFGSLAMALLAPVLNAGIMLGCEALHRGEKLDVAYLFAAFRSHAGKLIGVGAFALVAFVGIFAVVALTVGGELFALMTGAADPSPDAMTTLLANVMIALLVILGLSVPVYMAIWFAAPLIVLGEQDVGAALKSSFGACLKNVMPFLVWGIVALGLAIVATIPLGLGWLLLGPVLMVSVYTSYRDIFYVSSAGGSAG
ncbi:MAG TPA: BPSS1780 family membrane protein [Vicinamibacterales bacterium]|nr:BPSS1780 family membrane protein [Vicinamibacterales bacterium]